MKPITPTSGARWALRCTTAGTSAGSEPTWPTTNNGTVTTGGAVFTNVTGQSTYFWTAAAGDHQTLNGTVGAIRNAAGDRVFLSSDHTESIASGTAGPGSTITATFGVIQYISVNRAGSTPPVAADVTAGAAMTSTSSMIIRFHVNAYFNGVSFQTAGGGGFTFNDGTSVSDKTAYFQNCTFNMSVAGSFGYSANSGKVVFDNTTWRCAGNTQGIVGSYGELVWINTASPLPGTAPLTLVSSGSGASITLFRTFRGVDLSVMTGTLVTGGTSGNAGVRVLFDSCKIAAAVTRISSLGHTQDVVELVNCYDGTSFISERHESSGSTTTEFTITLSGGATDNVGTFSHKMVSNANSDKYCNTLDSFWMDLNYATTGGSKTATVEIISSASLNNDEISLELEYLGTASSSVASFVRSLPATVLTTAAAVTTSTATWNSSPATPAKQKLQVTFTPLTVGRLRGRVRLGKASTTVYVNPQITVT